MSLVDGADEAGAVALRELLSLYSDDADAAAQRQIEGVISVSSRPITRRLPTSGPISFGRGLEISIKCEDGAFEGTGVYLLGAVLEEFFARYVSTNSFTETVLRTDDRGDQGVEGAGASCAHARTRGTGRGRHRGQRLP